MPDRFRTVLEDSNGAKNPWIYEGVAMLAVFGGVVGSLLILGKHASDFQVAVVGSATSLAILGSYFGISELIDSRRGKKFTPAGEVTIGEDGVHLTEHGVTDFVHFAEVTEVAWTGGSCRLSKQSGGFVSFRPANEETCRARLEESRARYDARKPVRIVISCGPKEGETARGWSARMAKTDTYVYRGESLNRDELLRIAETPTSPRLERIGATLALTHAPAPIRAKVRVAIESLADRALGDAMEDALEGEVSEEVLAWRDG